MPIRQLEPDVAAKIAAGEVVERPASVVKELIENSIDARASQIRVELSQGGLQLIRITDNGCGIPPEELPLALSRHATSKVAQIDDLEHIVTLGFRGEALASIAAVAEVTLLSRPAEQEQGAQIEAQSGHITEVSPAASPEGTTITVRNLFSSVPARLKFIKSRNTESNHCRVLLEQYALAYPEVRFSVYSDGRQILSTPGNGNLTSALAEIYGVQVAEQMVPVRSEEHSDDPTYPRITGYTSQPSCYKTTRQYISFFVNRRWVMSRVLTTAVERGYGTLLLVNRHPVSVINIEIDPTLLDVNVHPAKTEIRFLKERRVFASIQRAIRAALLAGTTMPEWGDRTAATTTKRSVAGTADDEPLGTIEVDPTSGEVTQFAGTTRPREQSVAPYPEDSPWQTASDEEQGTQPRDIDRLWQSHVHPQQKRRDTTHSSSADPEAPDSDSSALDDIWNEETPNGEASGTAAGNNPSAELASSAGSHQHDEPAMTPIERVWQQRQASSRTAATASTATTERPISPDAASEDTANDAATQSTSTGQLANETQSPIDGLSAGVTVEASTAANRRLPKLRVVGQVAQSYIVTEGEGGMYLIDQHAAHERIILERMVAAMRAREPLSQLLLTPIQLELSPHEFEGLEEHREQLEGIGFKFSFEDGIFEVRAVPSVLVKQMNTHSLHELLIELTSEESMGDIGTWEEHALANVACKAAIKQNYFLTVSEMREMLEQLEQTQAPYSCCHGRPTMVHFGMQALARAFDRR